MAQKKTVKVKTKIKKKKWYKVLAPKIFLEQVIGYVPGESVKALVGKTIEVNLYNLTRNIKTQNTYVKLRITHFREENACTDIISYKLSSSSLKRFVKKNTSKIEESFVCKTSDKINVRVKIILVTKSLVNGGISKNLRKISRERVLKYISSNKFDVLVKELVIHKLQNTLKNETSKTYPLRLFEITSLSIVGSKLASKEAIEPEIETPDVSKIEKDEKSEEKIKKTPKTKDEKLDKKEPTKESKKE